VAIVQVVTGRLEFIAEGELLDVGSAFWLHMDPGTPHSLTAREPTSCSSPSSRLVELRRVKRLPSSDPEMTSLVPEGGSNAWLTTMTEDGAIRNQRHAAPAASITFMTAQRVLG
jgi:hypothetical protein